MQFSRYDYMPEHLALEEIRKAEIRKAEVRKGVGA
jgi:hypothetical protein